MKTVLTIAGSDTIAGAGIQADLKTFSELGVYGLTVITAITAQNTTGVQSVYPIPATVVSAQINSVLSDIEIDAIKIGMLCNSEIMEVVANKLSNLNIPIILDPVFVSSSGTILLDTKSIDLMKQRLFPLITLLTPNIQEAETLLNISIKTALDTKMAAVEIGKLLSYKGNVLIKGGHLINSQSTHSQDILSNNKGEITLFELPYLTDVQTHGTGCILSSAITAYLAMGLEMNEAITNSKKFLYKLIEKQHIKIGKGRLKPLI